MRIVGGEYHNYIYYNNNLASLLPSSMLHFFKFISDEIRYTWLEYYFQSYFTRDLVLVKHTEC